ncbi:hypothetical protein H7H31_06125 [Streptomyces buecherae]|nr:hypothetical protein H7H31_06125 [Streptomyces buecherae]
MLSALGLDEGQESTYRTLVALGAAEVPELALRLFRSEEDVERALRRLERQGLAARSAGRAERWVAVPPDAALGTLLGRRRQELERAERAVAVLTDEYRNGAPRSATQDAVEIARGTTAIGHRSLQLLAAATDEVCALVPATERLPRGVPLRPGVRHRVVVERALLSRPPALGELAASLGRGYEAKVRVVDRLPTTLLAVDGHLALVALHRPCCATTPSRGPGAASEAYDGAPAEPRDEPYAAAHLGAYAGTHTGTCDEGVCGRGARGEALVVHPSGLLAALLALFEGVWREAVPLRPEAARPGAARPAAPSSAPPDGPDATDLDILSLLLAGLTDASVAKQLDLGLRTVQRRVKGLMERAGVTTRLQLGWHAYELRWISRPPRPTATPATVAAPPEDRPHAPQPPPPLRPPMPRTPAHGSTATPERTTAYGPAHATGHPAKATADRAANATIRDGNAPTRLRSTPLRREPGQPAGHGDGLR